MSGETDGKTENGGQESGVPHSGGSSKEVPQVELVFRNPNPGKAGDLSLRVEPGATIGELKEMICERYEGHPPPREQVLIHAGKVLKESSACVADVLKNIDGPGPYSMHLVIKGDTLGARSRRSGGARHEALSPGRWMGSGGSAAAGPSPSDVGGGNSQSGTSPVVGGATPEVSGAAVQAGSQIAMVPSGAVALPCMMMSPVVTAAYNAAMAAISSSNAEGSASTQEGTTAASPSTAQGTGGPVAVQSSQALPRFIIPPNPMMPGTFLPGMQVQLQSGQSADCQGQQSATGQSPPPQQSLSNIQSLQNIPNAAPLIPAIAFFPLGVPVMVPSTTPPQGFHAQGQPNVRYIQLAGNRVMGVGPNPGQQGRTGPNHHIPAPNQGGRRRRVLMFRISIRGLLQLVLVLTFLYNYCTKGRFFLLVGLFVMLYLLAGPLRWLLSQISRGPGNNQADTSGEQNLNQHPNQHQHRARGFLTEVLMLVVGFVTSLLPTWNINAQDEAAFAAAQEMMVREGDRDGANGNGNGNDAPAPQQLGQDNPDAHHQHQD